MIKLYKDNFDSDIYDRNVYKLFIDEKIDSEDTIIKALKSKDISYLHCFTIFENSNIDVLNKLGFRLISIRNIYKKNLDESYLIQDVPNGFRVLKNSEKQVNLSDQEISSLVSVIGGTSRHFKDSELSKEKSFALYVTWIKNSLYYRYTDESFVIFAGNELAGIITLKIRKEGGYIDLIGVKERFQNKGLGGVLFQEGVRYLLSKNVKKMYAITENENILATRFYQKRGFLIESMQLVYHKIINNT